MSSEEDKARFTISDIRRSIKYTFCCNVVLILGASVMLFLYGAVKMADNPCNGLASMDKESPLYGGSEDNDYGSLEVRCRRQNEYRGYPSTDALVTAGLLPANAAYVFTSTETAGDDFEDIGKNFMCRLVSGRDSDQGKVTHPATCEQYMTGGGTAGQDCERDADDKLVDECCSKIKEEDPKHRVNIHGEDGNCLITRLPELCRETGVGDISVKELKKLADAQDIAEITGIGTIVLAVLATLSFLNYFHGVLDLLLCGMLGGLCQYGSYGETCCLLMPINLGGLYAMLTNIDCCGGFPKNLLYKTNALRENAKDKENSNHEAGLIYLSNLVHNLLILTASLIYYYSVNEVYNDQCLGASYDNIPRPRSTDVFSGTARKYLESGSDKVDKYGDALLKLQANDGIKTTLEVLFVINCSLGALSILAFLFSKSNTEDMDNMSFNIVPEDNSILGTLKSVFSTLNLSLFGGKDLTPKSASYTKLPGKDKFSDPYTRRTVQLRGQF